jgi:hypothetical protein
MWSSQKLNTGTVSLKSESCTKRCGWSREENFYKLHLLYFNVNISDISLISANFELVVTEGFDTHTGLNNHHLNDEFVCDVEMQKGVNVTNESFTEF